MEENVQTPTALEEKTSGSNILKDNRSRSRSRSKGSKFADANTKVEEVDALEVKCGDTANISGDPKSKVEVENE